MATLSLVYNILHTTPTHHHHLSSSLYWDGKLPGVVSLFRAHIVPLLLLLVVAVVTLANPSHKPKNGKSEIFGISFFAT